MTTFQGIDGISETRELTLLSNQRLTKAPPNVFDISQFKLAVGKDVSAHIVEKLQKIFGEDIAGAIDKYFDMKSKASKVPTKKDEEKLDMSIEHDRLEGNAVVQRE